MEFSTEERKALFDGRKVSAILPYDSIENNRTILQEGNGRLSISGAQEKYAVVEDNGVLRFTLKDEPGRFIIKPSPSDRRFVFREDMPANEHLTMSIAQTVYRIPVAAHGLCQFQNGEMVYITRRFDYRPDGRKYAMEDFASLSGLNKEQYGEYYKYNILSYEDCAALIARYCLAAKVELLKFYRQLIFNYLFSNADAHLKNFSLMEYSAGDYRLSPAYDLLDTALHIPSGIFALEKGLFKEGTRITDTTPIGRPLFYEFGKRLGFREIVIEKELAFFARKEVPVQRMIQESRLSPEAKQSYYQDYRYRLSTMQ